MFSCFGLNASSNEGRQVVKKLSPEYLIPFIIILVIEKEENNLNIKFMLEHTSLVENEGEIFFEFLRNAYDGIK